MTFIDSIVIIFGGKKLFKKAQKNEKSAMYPVANLFTVLEITEMSTFYGILFFVPVVNCVVLSIMFYKLGNVFSTSGLFKVGLMFLPIIFFPILASSDKQYKLSDEEYLLKLDSAKDYSVNLLSDEELNEEVLAFLIDKQVLSKESAKKLVDQNKIHINNKVWDNSDDSDYYTATHYYSL